MSKAIKNPREATEMIHFLETVKAKLASGELRTVLGMAFAMGSAIGLGSQPDKDLRKRTLDLLIDAIRRGAEVADKDMPRPADRDNPKHRAAVLEWIAEYGEGKGETLDDMIPHALVSGDKLAIVRGGVPLFVKLEA